MRRSLCTRSAGHSDRYQPRIRLCLLRCSPAHLLDSRLRRTKKKGRLERLGQYPQGSRRLQAGSGRTSIKPQSLWRRWTLDQFSQNARIFRNAVGGDVSEIGRTPTLSAGVRNGWKADIRTRRGPPPSTQSLSDPATRIHAVPDEDDERSQHQHYGCYYNSAGFWSCPQHYRWDE